MEPFCSLENVYSISKNSESERVFSQSINPFPNFFDILPYYLTHHLLYNTSINLLYSPLFTL